MIYYLKMDRESNWSRHLWPFVVKWKLIFFFCFEAANSAQQECRIPIKATLFGTLEPSDSSLFTVRIAESWPQLLSTLSRSLTPGLSRPTPLSICESWRAVGSALFLHRQAPLPGSLLCQLHLPSPAPPISCYLWYTVELCKTCLPLSQQGWLCCVILHYMCLSPIFPLTVDSHCITAVCYNTGSHCKGSASIRVPIIIPNQLHFSI